MSNSGALKSDRIVYMDLLRCVSVYLVILLHCISSTLSDASLLGTRLWWTCDILNSAVRMGVPLFFTLSGALLLSDPRTADPLPFYVRRLGRILLPFLCWDILYFFENAYLAAQTPGFTQFFVELLTKMGSKYHLWFVYKIVGIYLLLPFLKRVLDQCKTRDAVLLLVIILLQPSIFPLISLLPGIEIDLFGTLLDGRIGYFILGWLLSQKELSRLTKRLLYVGGIFGFLLNVFGIYLLSTPGQVNLWFNNGCALTHFLTASAVFVLFKELGSFPAAIASLGRIVSSLSFGIYLSHALFLDFWRILLSKMELSQAALIVTSFVATSISATAASWLLSKCKPLRRLLVG